MGLGTSILETTRQPHNTRMDLTIAFGVCRSCARRWATDEEAEELMERVRVFLSSTQVDLRPERDSAGAVAALIGVRSCFLTSSVTACAPGTSCIPRLNPQEDDGRLGERAAPDSRVAMP